MSQFFVKQGSSVHGPFSESKLRDLLNNGTIPGDASIKQGENGEYLTVAHVQKTFEQLEETGWYIKSFNTVHGPFVEAKLRKLLKSGKIPAASRITQGKQGAELSVAYVQQQFLSLERNGWYIQSPDGILGPFVKSKIEAMVTSGTINDSTKVRRGQNEPFKAYAAITKEAEAQSLEQLDIPLNEPSQPFRPHKSHAAFYQPTTASQETHETIAGSTAVPQKSGGMSGVAKSFLDDAKSEQVDSQKSQENEKSRLKFILVSTSIFMVLFVPPTVWLTYRFLRQAQYAALEHEAQASQASLLRRAKAGKAIGAEAQKPLDIMLRREFLNKKNRQVLASSYQSKVEGLLTKINKATAEARKSRGLPGEAEQGMWQWLRGDPKELTVDELAITVSDGEHLIADVHIIGGPLRTEYWGKYYISDPDKITWVFTWDNYLRVNRNKTLRKNLRDTLSSAMQAPAAFNNGEQDQNLKPVNIKALPFTEDDYRRNLAARLSEIKKTFSERSKETFKIGRFIPGEWASFEVSVPITYTTSSGDPQKQVTLVVTLSLAGDHDPKAYKRNLWTILDDNRESIVDNDNRNRIDAICKQLESLEKLNLRYPFK